MDKYYEASDLLEGDLGEQAAQARQKILESLKCVDEVIIFEEDSPYQLIQKVNPDIITKGGDYVTKTYDVNGRQIQTTIIPYVEGYSTTKILGDK